MPRGVEVREMTSLPGLCLRCERQIAIRSDFKALRPVCRDWAHLLGLLPAFPR